jgi:cellulose synthase/poly-beta-1,6-N-acetylglucosamine synthase-like glycosyltransferase
MTEKLLLGLPSLVPNLYLGILALISLYGFHKLLMVWRFYKHRGTDTQPFQTYPEAELPTVTVQLPVFNEMYVIERLLEAICQLNYPQDKLEIQVLDDSLDETQKICREKVLDLQKQHPNIRYLHRQDRWGFKAGALDCGLQSASGELVIIFDADFIPAPDTLLKMVHHFSDPAVGMVQARWTHLNRNYSLLTEIQALMLDGHFVIEQTARNRSGCFFNFNGTAGIWRVSAIEDAGGWEHTTVTEDLDLSYRVQLKGWRCIYLPDVMVPAELPMEMNAFKSQQFRWAKGASQVANKLLPTIFRADIPLHVKLESFLHMTNNVNYLLLLAVLLLSLPYQIYIAENHWEQDLFIYLPIFIGTTLNLICFYLVSQYEQGIRKSGWKFMSDIFFLMSIGVGLSINQSLAVCEGFLQVDSEFIRTPKHGVINNTENWITKKYRAAKTRTIILEFSMLAYLALTLVLAIYYQHYWSLPFLILFNFGYFYVLRLSVFQSR